MTLKATSHYIIKITLNDPNQDPQPINWTEHKTPCQLPIGLCLPPQIIAMMKPRGRTSSLIWGLWVGRGGGRGGLAVVSQSTISSIHHGNYLASPRVLCPLAALSQVIMIRRRWAEIYTFRRLSIILGTPCGDPGEVHTGYQRAADARLLVLVRAAVCWLLMKMLCDEQPGCGARGPANPRPWLHRSPWPPAG